ncbi:hypothetical protein [Lacticaseibacillus nasuensis]|uniref:SbcC family exonuclease n=1 Tax=Lacticaseibacillus nasuensis JCM 17158 TaxID=1291734 RepID=A0A0R1JTU5_9LACO|nr:hypothetical protein [Lacticaseibacillus nasuensis]KRK70994.1 hypothetical protein FD02_GL000177 [Lacticaseibacillus nasuensis JCM 17158]
MTIQSSLDYQTKFFTDFAKAWADHSTFRLYQGIDTTAENLRLELSDAPGYILAYDKSAQRELADFLAGDLIKFLREHIPFFEVTDDGRVFFGDWYHRREFGQLSVFARTINQVTPEQQVILPQLEAFAADPDNYLDHQVDALQKKLYQEVNRLHAKLESAQAEPVAAPQPSSGSTLRGLFKNFIDPGDDTEDAAPSAAQPQVPTDTAALQSQFAAAKAEADAQFDTQKRELQVSAAITRYEYAAVMNTYSSVEQFENVLANLPTDFMHALDAKGGRANA